MAKTLRTEVAIVCPHVHADGTTTRGDDFQWRVKPCSEDVAGSLVESIFLEKNSWQLAHLVLQRKSKRRLCNIFGSAVSVFDQLRNAREVATLHAASPMLADTVAALKGVHKSWRKRKHAFEQAKADEVGWVDVQVRGVTYTVRATTQTRSTVEMQLTESAVYGFIKASSHTASHCGKHSHIESSIASVRRCCNACSAIIYVVSYNRVHQVCWSRVDLT